MKSILLVKTFLGLVEMMSGLVNASFSLPEWQAVKMIFFAPWIFVVLKLVWTVSSPWGVGESGWRREKLTFSSCISSASFSVYLFFTVQQSPSLFCTPQAGDMQCFLPHCMGVGSIVWFPDQAAAKETNIAMWKMLFPLLRTCVILKEETLVTQIVGVRVVLSVPSSLVLTNSTD